jgi:uncharacterized protein DUF4440
MQITMNERDRVAEASERMADAIARRDLAAIRELLAPGFVHRTHGGAGADADAFIRAIQEIPFEIMSVRLEQLEIDICATGALVTGIQHAQVRVDDQAVDDRRGFVDWFVQHAGAWRIQAAVDLPAPAPE